MTTKSTCLASIFLHRSPVRSRPSRCPANGRRLTHREGRLLGPSFEVGLAEIQARAGEPQETAKTLRRLLAIPAGASVSLQRLKIDPVWDPIRDDPAFQELLTGTEHIGP